MMKTVIFAVCSFLAMGFFCLADDAIWYGGPGSGSFGEPTNWSYNLVPGAWDRAIFPFMNYPYTVTFDQGYENKAMIVNGAELTLDLNGNEYYLNSSWQDGPAAVIGESDTLAISSLLLVHGNVYSRDMVIGLWQDTHGQLTLSGPDAQWTTLFDGDWNGVWLGQIGGDVTLEVLDGAQFKHGHGASAIDAASDAAIQVDGVNSQWYVDGQFDMSNWGTTTVNVTNGGLVDIGKLTMAMERGSSAQINLTGENQQLGLQLHAGFENSLTIGQNGQAAIRLSGSSLWNQGTMTLGENLGSSGLLEIHEGATVFCDNSVAVGGNFDRAGGKGRIELIDDTPGNGIETEFRVQAEGQEYMKVWPKGTIVLDGGHITVQNNSGQPNPIILQGTLEGNGYIWGYLENRGGLVAPTDEYNGNRLSVGYDYTQDAAGTLKIALRSNEHYPAIQVNNPDFGQANLGGMLDVELVEGFVPGYDDRFEIVRATTVSGTFINATEYYLFEDGRFEVEYNNDSIVLTHYSAEPSCPNYSIADLNKDCLVNLADFAMFAAEWLDCNLVPESDCAGYGVVE